MLTVLVVALALVAIALAGATWWHVRDRRTVRAALDAEPHQPTTAAVRRLQRRTVPRQELSGALFSREALLDASPLPALVIDGDGRIERLNASARMALPGADVGIDVIELSPRLARAVADALSGPPVEEVEFAGGETGRTWVAHVRSHPAAEGRGATAVLVEVTDDVDYREARRLFSAAVSHELRTPLQRIVGLVETLGLPLSDAEHTDIVRSVNAEVTQMRELIDEMLLLAALDRGEAAMAEGESDPGEIAARVVQTRKERAREAGMTLSAASTNGLAVPVPDRLLEVVLGNLVDNALRYAGHGAAVHVSVRGRQGEVETIVRDTGVGIATEHLPHVFERFFRGDAARSTPGTGLGLAIVKHIVEAHGGRAAVESRLGQGTVVRLVLPEATTAGVNGG